MYYFWSNRKQLTRITVVLDQIGRLATRKYSERRQTLKFHISFENYGARRSLARRSDPFNRKHPLGRRLPNHVQARFLAVLCKGAIYVDILKVIMVYIIHKILAASKNRLEHLLRLRFVVRTQRPHSLAYTYKTFRSHITKQRQKYHIPARQISWLSMTSSSFAKS